MNFVLVILFLIISGIMNAQDNNKQLQKKESLKESPTQVQLSSQKDNPNATPVAEPNPTPEQQGYTKYTIDGKDLYYKQEGQLQIQFQPKND